MIVAVDVDDVLAEQTLKIMEFHNDYFGTNLSWADLDNYKYLGFFGETKAEGVSKLFKFYDSKYFPEMKPVPGSVEAINKLAKNHQLKILTGRPYAIKEETAAWVEKYFPCKFSSIHFNNDLNREQYNLENERSKAEICRELEADILIDDQLKYTTGGHDGLKILLLDRPWNQGETPPNVVRVNSWQEILEILNAVDENIVVNVY